MDIIKILREKDSEELNKIHNQKDSDELNKINNQKDLKDRLKAYPLFFVLHTNYTWLIFVCCRCMLSIKLFYYIFTFIRIILKQI